MSLRYTLAALALLLAAPLSSAQILFRADLTGANEVPPVTTTASGLATGVLDGSTLIVRGQFEGLESLYDINVGSHVHEGGPDENGPVIFALDPALTDNLRGGEWFGPENRFASITDEQIQALRAGNLYINVHSADNPGGEIRGQLLPAITLNEIRRDQPGADDDEYVELAGPAGASLDGYSLVILGDGGGSDRGVIEEIVELAGNSIPEDGYFLMGELTLATADLEVNLNLENSDSVTYLLVQGVPGTPGEDLDADNDGTLDTTPWSEVADAVGSVSTNEEDATYAEQLGFEDIGPNGTNPPAHLFRNRDDGVWRIGAFGLEGGFDTPGDANASTSLIQIVHSALGEDTDVVDVYLDGGLAVDDLAFRTATPFVLIPAARNVDIAITENDAASADDAFFTLSATLDGAPSYYAIASGVRDGEEGSEFDLRLYDNARRFSTTPGTVDVAFFHGTPDAPVIDVRTQGVAQAILFNDVAFGEYGDEIYQPTSAAMLGLEVSDMGGTPLAMFDVDFSGLADESVLVVASGYFNPEDGEPGFVLLTIETDGKAETFAVPQEGGPEAGELSLASVNPIRQSATVRFRTPVSGEASLTVFDALGRRVAGLARGPLAEGAHEAQWDTSGVAPGVYVLRLETDAGAITRMVTVVR